MIKNWIGITQKRSILIAISYKMSSLINPSIHFVYFKMRSCLNLDRILRK